MSIHRDRDNMYTLYKRDPDSRFEPRIFLWWDNSTNKYTLMPSPALKCLLKQKKNASKAAGKSRKTRGGGDPTGRITVNSAVVGVVSLGEKIHFNWD